MPISVDEIILDVRQIEKIIPASALNDSDIIIDDTMVIKKVVRKNFAGCGSCS